MCPLPLSDQGSSCLSFNSEEVQAEQAYAEQSTIPLDSLVCATTMSALTTASAFDEATAYTKEHLNHLLGYAFCSSLLSKMLFSPP